jgi:MFS family permease
MTTVTVSKKAHRIAVAAFFFIVGLSFMSWASRIPEIKLMLGLNEAALGSILLALPLGAVCSLPISGFLVAKYGSRKVILIAASCYPLVLILLGLAPDVLQLVTFLFVFGMLGNMCNISVNTQAVGVESLYGRSIMASFHGIWSLAGFCGAFIGKLMVSWNIGPRYHFLIICALSLLLILLVRRYTIEKDNVHPDQPIFAWPDAGLLKLGVIAFSCMACEGTMFDWSGVYFQEIVKAPKASVPLGLMVFMATMALGRFIGDRIITRFGRQKLLQASGLVICTGLLIAVVFPYLVSAMIGFLLVGFGVSSVVPVVYSSAGRSKKLSPGVALAAVSTIGFFGFLLGPPLIGFIAHASSLRWSFALIAVLGLGTTVLASAMKWEES